MNFRTFQAFPPNSILWGLAVLAFAGCKPQVQTQAPPPPPVTIAKPVQKEIVEWDEYTGRTDAVESVNITARVSGYIDKVAFKAGDLVEKGDLLFVIDPRPYQAIYDQALAGLHQADASRQLNEANFERASRLRATNVTSKEEFDTSVAQKAQADANYVASQAQVSSAKLNLDFTQVKAPIKGRIDRELVTAGNLVQADVTLLTTLVSVDPIYAYFNVDERSVLKYVEQIKAGQRVSARKSKTPVYLQLENEKGFPHEGVIDFISNRYTASTGTLQVRGVFPNPDGFLTPGAFVQGRIAGTAKHQALLMTDRAVGTDQGQKFVLVVEDQNLVGTRPVELGPVVDGLRVIRSGLKGNEQVIINGLVNARPGAPVNPQPGDINQFASPQRQLRATTSGAGDKPAGNPAPQEPLSAQGPPRNPAQQGK